MDSEAEAKVLIFCIVSIKQRRFAQASQVLEQFGVKRLRLLRSVVSTNRLRYHVRLQDYSMTALVSANTIDSRPVRSRCACTEVRLCIVQLELCLSVEMLKEE